MIKVGDLVVLKDATIRGPDGNLKQLEEAPYYGVVIGLNTGHPDPATNEKICRIMWFTKGGEPARTNDGLTLEYIKDIEKISK
jgi:hypothetical protein